MASKPKRDLGLEQMERNVAAKMIGGAVVAPRSWNPQPPQASPPRTLKRSPFTSFYDKGGVPWSEAMYARALKDIERRQKKRLKRNPSYNPGDDKGA